jgi:hypothetical protein
LQQIWYRICSIESIDRLSKKCLYVFELHISIAQDACFSATARWSCSAPLWLGGGT